MTTLMSIFSGSAECQDFAGLISLHSQNGPLRQAHLSLLYM